MPGQEGEFLTREQIRDVDKVAIEKFAVPGIVLMENAGRGIAEVMIREGISARVVIACGKGNNGGDGLVVARQLLAQGVETSVLLFAPEEKFTGDARTNLVICQKLRVPLIDLSQIQNSAEVDVHLAGAAWVVDALLGTGAKGAPSEPLNWAIEALNRSSARKLAIDLPSGLDCDTGEPAEPTFRADLTCTMYAAKVGFAQEKAQPFLGRVEVIGLGIPCILPR